MGFHDQFIIQSISTKATCFKFATYKILLLEKYRKLKIHFPNIILHPSLLAPTAPSTYTLNLDAPTNRGDSVGDTERVASALIIVEVYNGQVLE